MRYRYDVGISYESIQRDYARHLASDLKKAGYRVFFDGYEQGGLFGKNLARELPRIFGHDCRLIVVCISESYVSSEYAMLEWKSIASRQESGNVLPIRFDGAELDGLSEHCVFLNAERYDPSAVAAEMIERFPPISSRFFRVLNRFPLWSMVAAVLLLVAGAAWLLQGRFVEDATRSTRVLSPAIHDLSGPIKAEDFASYFDTTPGNMGNANQFEGDVDVWHMFGGEGYIVGDVHDGDMTSYEIDVAVAGEYEVILWVASSADSGTVTVSLNDLKIVTDRKLTETGGWWTFEPVSVGTVDIPAGRHSLRIEWGSGQSNFDQIQLWRS